MSFTWLAAFYVFIGAGAGGLCRYVLVALLPFSAVTSLFFVSALGGFLVGAAWSLLPFNPATMLLFFTGFLGGFTTLSAIVLDSFYLVEHAEYLKGMALLFGHNMLAFTCAVMGFFLASFLTSGV